MHDYLTQRGGAERVVLDMLRTYPDARLITSFYAPDRTFPEFRDFRVDTLPINRILPLRADPRRAFPFLARAFAERVVTDADVVLCSSSGWSHRVVTTVPKVVFCHNPGRWLYQPHDYLPGLSPWLRGRFVGATEGMRRTDRLAARGADRYLVASSVVACRVRACYGIESATVAPARGLSPDGAQEPVNGLEPGYLLTVARPRGYKHTRAVCEAVAGMPGERLVVVGGDVDAQTWPLNVTRMRNLGDAQLRWLYANASALVAVAHEDFGLTVPEAQAFGVPVATLRAGGYLDTNVEDLTGVFVDTVEPAAIRAGVAKLRSRHWDRDAIRRSGERYSVPAFSRRLRREVNAAQRPLRVIDGAGVTASVEHAAADLIGDPAVGLADDRITMAG